MSDTFFWTHCLLTTADCRLTPANCRLTTADSRLPTADCRLTPAELIPPSSLCSPCSQFQWLQQLVARDEKYQPLRPTLWFPLPRCFSALRRGVGHVECRRDAG